VSPPAPTTTRASYFDRQVALYESVLSAGAAAGRLAPAPAVQSVARGLVALEDGLGLQVVLGHPSIDSAEAERILLDYAGAMTGALLEA
jgi:hypothetical protein